MLASSSVAHAGTIAPKNIARLRSSDGRTLAAFASVIQGADGSFGRLPDVGMHARIDGASMRNAAYAWAARGDDRFLERTATLLRGARTILADDRNVARQEPAQLDALVDAYAIVRDVLPAEDRSSIDRVLGATARTLAASGSRLLDPHRIDVAGCVGLLIDDSALSGEAMSAFVDFIDSQIAADGRTNRATRYDSLAVQADDIAPLVHFALAAERNGRRLFRSANERGASLATAVAFLEPYATGHLAHREYAMSSVPQELRLPFDPTETIHIFALASHFDARYDGLHVHGVTIGEIPEAILARLDR